MNNHKIDKIVWISVDELLTYPNNAKRHDARQIERIKESIERFGFNDPIAIDSGNVIIEGHGRLIASKELGYEKLPCIYLDHLTEEEAKAYRNIHNKLTMDTGFDYDLLQIDLGEITNIPMSDFGFETEKETPEEELIEVQDVHEYEFDQKGRVIFSYKDGDEEEWLKKLLGVEELDKALYTVKELMAEGDE